jgi:predicted PurR-regulated permease PerM
LSYPEVPSLPTPPETPHPWSQRTQDLWFFAALALSAIGVAYLFSSFLYVLMFAAVVVVVSWPLFQRMVGLWRGRRALAAVSTALLIVVAVFGPLGFFAYLFVKQAATLVSAGAELVSSGAVAAWLEKATTRLDWMPLWMRDWLPADFDLQQTIAGPLQEGALSALNLVGNAVPSLVGSTMGAGIDLVIFVFAVLTLYLEGPRVLRVLQDLSPMDDAYEARLFAVFREFANNLVLGALVTAAVQGAVAGVGYQIAGVDRVVFFAMLTGVCAFVPFVGTLIVWVPLAILVGIDQGLGWGLFLAGWGVGVAHIDNFVRPMFMRGRTQIHPLLIFLAVFGGLGWLGLPGALIGPVMVAGFLALYTIYTRDYLGRPDEPEPVVDPSERRPAWLARLVGWGRALLEALGIRKAGAVEPREEDQPTLREGATVP